MYSEINLNCVKPRKGPTVLNFLRKFINLT